MLFRGMILFSLSLASSAFAASPVIECNSVESGIRMYSITATLKSPLELVDVTRVSSYRGQVYTNHEDSMTSRSEDTNLQPPPDEARFYFEAGSNSDFLTTKKWMLNLALTARGDFTFHAQEITQVDDGTQEVSELSCKLK